MNIVRRVLRRVQTRLGTLCKAITAHQVTAFVTLLLALATAALAIVAYRQITIMENDQRAWVSASDISVSGVTWKDGEARFTVAVKLKNTGKSPALSVDVMPVAYPSWDLAQLLKKQRELSEAQRHHPSKMGTMVFPGDIIPAGVNIGLSRDDIATFQKAIQNVAKDNKLEPSAVTSVPTGILIVIDYRSAEKDEHHQTGYVLNLYYRDPAQPKAPGLSLPIGLAVPAENLRLEQHLLGQYAD